MILNGQPINPGQLRTQIALQTSAVTQDAGGFPSRAWTTVATVWSRWTNAHGAEAVAAQAAQAEGSATVLIRYRAGLDTTCAVLKGSERYEITSIDDIQERHEYMELQVRKTKGG
jgi:SPP1 family predicted phage head-tail adaptor